MEIVSFILHSTSITTTPERKQIDQSIWRKFRIFVWHFHESLSLHTRIHLFTCDESYHMWNQYMTIDFHWNGERNFYVAKTFPHSFFWPYKQRYVLRVLAIEFMIRKRFPVIFMCHKFIVSKSTVSIPKAIASHDDFFSFVFFF